MIDPVLLPDGTRLLHIGPHKTGTTALQSAFHMHRRGIAEQGVHYAGSNRQPMQAAHAVTGRSSPYADGARPSMARWRELVREVRRANGQRVVISSEGFADADDDAIRKVLADLGSPIHVVVTLRPLADILPSQWQQYVQGGLTMAYEPWLEMVLAQGPLRATPNFWHRHRHDLLVQRWAAAAGPQNVTVIVADDRDRGSVLRAFERLVGLRTGTLVPDAELGNRSLTWPEVETIRALNARFRAEGLGNQLYNKVVRFGAVEYLKRRQPEDAEPRITTPPWASEKAAAIATEIVDGIRTSGVRVIGDLEALAAAPSGAGEAETGAVADSVAADVAAATAVGIVLATGLARGAKSVAGLESAWPDGPLGPDARMPRPQVEPLELARLSTPLVGFVLVRRVVGAITTRVRLPRRRRR